MSIYSTRKSKKQKNGPSGAPGPASASPWRAKRGTLPKLSTFLSQLKGDPLENFFKVENIFQKISVFLSLSAKKSKGGPFSLVWFCMLRYKRTTIISSIWFNLAPQKLVEPDKTILANSCGLKKVTIIVAFHFVKRRLKA